MLARAPGVSMTDFLVLGGGIAGAAAAHFLSVHGEVTVLEAEAAPGYHATGRSAGLFSAYYGNRVVRALTAASQACWADLLTPRGVVALAPHGAEKEFAQALADGLTAPLPARELPLDEVQRLCPIVRPGWYGRAMFKAAGLDIDTAGAHHRMLRGVQVVTRARVTALHRRSGLWHASTTNGPFAAPVIVNAAGAWADEVARMAGIAALGLRPLRRTAAIIPAPDRRAVDRWPMVADVTETFYFKPESGGLLVSPADATPVAPHDVRPDDLDVARAVARFEEVTTVQVARVCHRWAGLRTTAPDDTPVVGEASGATGFFWLAGLGGYGFQVAPAVAELLAALVTGSSGPRATRHLAAPLSPLRASIAANAGRAQ